MKKFYNESKTDGFGAVVIAGIIMTVTQTLSVVTFLILALLWILTQDSSFGWALLWPVGFFVVNMLAAVIFSGVTAIKMSKEF